MKAFGNVLGHFFLGVAFIIVGIYVTIVAYTAFTQLGVDPYGLKQGPHPITTITGQPAVESEDNVATCPAFPNCAAQKSWMIGAHKRGMMAVIGCVLFDIAL
jgi:hypothetical protein